MSDENQIEGINDASNQEKNSEIEVEEDKENNQKMSIPENPIQNVHNLDNKEMPNRLSEFPNNMYVKDSQYNTNNNFNPGIMSTGHFMQNIDLRCDDHKNKFNIDIQATRFCSKCKVLCCDTCVIDFHNDHINFAKIKIEEYFKNAKLKIENLQSKVNNSIRFKLNNQEIDNIINNQNKILDAYFNGRKNKYEDLKKKIDIIIQNDNEIYEKLKEKISIFYKDDCFIRMNQPLKENENLLNKIKNLNQEINNKNNSLISIENSKNELQNKILDLKTQINKEKNEKENLQKKLENFEQIKQEKFNLEVESENIKFNNKNLTEEIFTLKNKIKNLNNIINENDNNNLKSKKLNEKNESLIIELKEKIENHYKVKFKFDDKFLYFPYFKGEGKYSDLSF